MSRRAPFRAVNSRDVGSLRSSVDARWQPYQITLIQALITEVDGYVRELRRYLIREIQFGLLPGGAPNIAPKLEDSPYHPGEVARVSNKRCDRVRQYATQLMDPDGAPVFPILFSSFRYSRSGERSNSSAQTGRHGVGAARYQGASIAPLQGEFLGLRPNSLLSRHGRP